MGIIQNLKDKISGRVPPGTQRSDKWPEVEKAFLKDNPHCGVCKTDKDLNVHHVRPFHLEPALELDPSNLITLCRDHHFLFGHLLDWKSFNVSVVADASSWDSKIKNRP